VFLLSLNIRWALVGYIPRDFSQKFVQRIIDYYDDFSEVRLPIHAFLHPFLGDVEGGADIHFDLIDLLNLSQPLLILLLGELIDLLKEPGLPRIHVEDVLVLVQIHVLVLPFHGHRVHPVVPPLQV